jgi:hypothetical protein
LILFSSQKGGRIAKRTTWFDIAPALLDIIENNGYDPELPYRESETALGDSHQGETQSMGG